MIHKNLEPLQLDIINYLAIDSLEKIGNLEPTQSEISSMEEILALSISSILKGFQQKREAI